MKKEIYYRVKLYIAKIRFKSNYILVGLPKGINFCHFRSFSTRLIWRMMDWFTSKRLWWITFFSHWKRQILIHIQVFLRAMNEEMDNACEKNLKASLQLFHSFTTTRKFSLQFGAGESAALPIRREWNGGNELQKLLCECPFLQFDWNTFPNSRFYHLIMLIYWNMFFWILVQLFLVAKMR